MWAICTDTIYYSESGTGLRALLDTYSKPGGVNWVPGTIAEHKSLTQFQKELLCDHNIKLSRSKIQKILISGNCWSTERSRQIQKMYGEKIKENSKANLVVKEIADELGISVVTVNINLPYGKVVYDLKDKSSNAKRIDRWRSKQRLYSRFNGNAL